jgi:holo-[acyl-carrier protein] synthase
MSNAGSESTVPPAASGAAEAGSAGREPRRPGMRVGIDLIEIQRIHRALERYPGFRDRCFTAAEQAYCDSRANPAESYAGRFAGKEAVGKALGVGVRFTWKEIEIVGRPKPSVRLHGRTKVAAERLRAGAIDLSMTHSRELAAAICVVLDGD